jgi:tRNA threonylcarbamoyladenosine biosynthesis protein TsaE
MKQEIIDTQAMIAFGARIGAQCVGGEVIELVGDIGAGKTTFTKGLAAAMGIDDDIQSPTFTISRVYDANDGKILAHYDFYRLDDAGIMSAELAESVHDDHTVTVIEWGSIITDILPADTLTIEITPQDKEMRVVTMTAGGEKSRRVMKGVV